MVSVIQNNNQTIRKNHRFVCRHHCPWFGIFVFCRQYAVWRTISKPNFNSGNRIANQLQDQTINQDSQIPEINDDQPAEAYPVPNRPRQPPKKKTKPRRQIGPRPILSPIISAPAPRTLFWWAASTAAMPGTPRFRLWNHRLFKSKSDAIGANAKITVILALNIDGLNKVVDAAGKTSAADISASPTARRRPLQRQQWTQPQFSDCDWKETGLWQNKTVSGGTAAFSEPETAAFKNYVQENKPAAVVAWYVSGGGVYASSCGNGILPETQTILNIYANASGYPAHKNFESYQVSGDMTDWFAKNGIPAIGILLKPPTKPNGTKTGPA